MKLPPADPFRTASTFASSRDPDSRYHVGKWVTREDASALLDAIPVGHTVAVYLLQLNPSRFTLTLDPHPYHTLIGVYARTSFPTALQQDAEEAARQAVKSGAALRALRGAK